MSTKLLAGLLAMLVVAGVGIYAGVTKFYAPDATALNSDSPCCASKVKALPSCQAGMSCCADAHEEEADESCCAAKANYNKQFISACTGNAALQVEMKPSGCAKCNESHCEDK